MQCVVPCGGPPKFHHIIWMRNLNNLCALATEDGDDDLFSHFTRVNDPDLRKRNLLKFLYQVLVLYAGSRAEQLTMGAWGGYKEADADVMLIFQQVLAPFKIKEKVTDPAYCLVKVELDQLHSNFRNLIYKWGVEDYLSADLFRVRAVNNRGANVNWSELELHGPAWKACLTDLGELDIVVCAATSTPFQEMNPFRERMWESHMLDVVPLNLLCELNGVLVPVCSRGDVGVERLLTFRKSFSAQEIILLTSLPRWCRQAAVVFKHTVLCHLPTIVHNPRNDPLISSHHLKTIFLWAVESMSVEMWEQTSSARLLLKLFSILIHSLEIKELKNYWVPRSNLLKYHSAAYLTKCCQTVKAIEKDIIAYISNAPNKKHKGFVGLDLNAIKDMFQQARYSKSRFNPNWKLITQMSTWRLMVKLILESSGSPQCLRQVGDLVLDLETLWVRISGEGADENEGFVMGSYIVGELLKDTDSRKGGVV